MSDADERCRARPVDGLEADPMTAEAWGCCSAARQSWRAADPRRRVPHVMRTAPPLNSAAYCSAARPSWSGSMRSDLRSTAWRGRCRAPRVDSYVPVLRSRGNHDSHPPNGDQHPVDCQHGRPRAGTAAPRSPRRGGAQHRPARSARPWGAALADHRHSGRSSDHRPSWVDPWRQLTA